MQIETQQIELAPLGSVSVVPPSPSVVYDIVSEWSASPSQKSSSAAVGQQLVHISGAIRWNIL